MATTIADLRKLTKTDLVDGDIELFVTTANMVVDKYLTSLISDTTILDSIALYLAGHFYIISVEGGGLTYRRVGQSEERYKSFGYDNAGFMSTRFGQQACALDSSNTLIDISMPKRISFEFETFSALRSAREAQLLGDE